MRPKDVAALVLLAAVWGGSFPLIRVAAPALGPLPLAAGRVTLAALVLWLGLRAAGRPVAFRGYWGRLLVLGGVNAALPFALIATAELRLTASLAAMLNATVPLWAALLGAARFGERLTPRRALGLGLGVLGVGVLVGWSAFAPTPGVLASVGAMLVASASYAAGGVYAKRRLADLPAPALALGQQLGAAAWLVGPALVQLPRAHPTRPAILALVALATLSTAAAYLLFFRLLAALGPTRTTTVTYLIPAFGAAWGALFLGEPVTGGMLAGLALVLGSLALVNDVRPRLPRRRAAGPEAAALGR